MRINPKYIGSNAHSVYVDTPYTYYTPHILDAPATQWAIRLAIVLLVGWTLPISWITYTGQAVHIPSMMIILGYILYHKYAPIGIHVSHTPHVATYGFKYHRKYPYPMSSIIYLNKKGQLHNPHGPAIIGRYTREWYTHDTRHRDGGPAIYTTPDCNVQYSIYMHHGRIHRDDGPASIEGHETSWMHHGQLHRDDGPAYTDPHRMEWAQYDQPHRIDGPAISEYLLHRKDLGPTLYCRWMQRHQLHRVNGHQLHRVDGPAVMGIDGLEWYINGTRYFTTDTFINEAMAWIRANPEYTAHEKVIRIRHLQSLHDAGSINIEMDFLCPAYTNALLMYPSNIPQRPPQTTTH